MADDFSNDNENGNKVVDNNFFNLPEILFDPNSDEPERVNNQLKELKEQNKEKSQWTRRDDLQSLSKSKKSQNAFQFNSLSQVDPLKASQGIQREKFGVANMAPKRNPLSNSFQSLKEVPQAQSTAAPDIAKQIAERLNSRFKAKSGDELLNPQVTSNTTRTSLESNGEFSSVNMMGTNSGQFGVLGSLGSFPKVQQPNSVHSLPPFKFEKVKNPIEVVAYPVKKERNLSNSSPVTVKEAETHKNKFSFSFNNSSPFTSSPSPSSPPLFSPPFTLSNLNLSSHQNENPSRVFIGDFAVQISNYNDHNGR